MEPNHRKCEKVLFIAFLLFGSSICCAHGLALYVSTPISPPIELVWVLPVSMVVLAIVNVVVLRLIFKWVWLRCLRWGLAVVALFSVSFYLFGSFAANMTTAPNPGLGQPYPAFWGFGWEEGGGLFVRWNIYGVLFLTLWVCVMSKIWRNAKGLVIVATNIGIYMICLVPYVKSGGFLHGWGGGYVANACERRLEILTEALLRYAEHHEGRAPQGETLDDVLQELSPYIDHDYRPFYLPLDTCRLGAAYERTPRRYEWNKRFSGRNLHSISEKEISELLEDKLLFWKGPFLCPYHGMRSGRRPIKKLIEYIERKAKPNVGRDHPQGRLWGNDSRNIEYRTPTDSSGTSKE